MRQAKSKAPDPFADALMEYLSSRDGKLMLDPRRLGNPPNEQALKELVMNVFEAGWVCCDAAEGEE